MSYVCPKEARDAGVLGWVDTYHVMRERQAEWVVRVGGGREGSRMWEPKDTVRYTVRTLRPIHGYIFAAVLCFDSRLLQVSCNAMHVCKAIDQSLSNARYIWFPN